MADEMMREIFSTVADGCDAMRPGSGDAVRKLAEEKYPDHVLTHSEVLQHLANLCPRHARDLLPRPTESVCADCEVELEKRRINDPD